VVAAACADLPCWPCCPRARPTRCRWSPWTHSGSSRPPPFAPLPPLSYLARPRWTWSAWLAPDGVPLVPATDMRWASFSFASRPDRQRTGLRCLRPRGTSPTSSSPPVCTGPSCPITLDALGFRAAPSRRASQPTSAHRQHHRGPRRGRVNPWSSFDTGRVTACSNVVATRAVATAPPRVRAPPVVTSRSGPAGSDSGTTLTARSRRAATVDTALLAERAGGAVLRPEGPPKSTGRDLFTAGYLDAALIAARPARPRHPAHPYPDRAESPAPRSADRPHGGRPPARYGSPKGGGGRLRRRHAQPGAGRRARAALRRAGLRGSDELGLPWTPIA